MHLLIQNIKQRTVYFGLVSVLLLTGFLAICWFNQNEIFISLAGLRHSNGMHHFFSAISFLGNGYFAIGISILFIMVLPSVQLGMRLLCSFLLSGFLVQLIKNCLQLPRPRELMDGNFMDLYFANAHGGFNSFPSGHTTTAFALATIICVTNRSKKFQIPVFFLAFLVGYSRIYLGHHFLADVIGGCLLGTVCSLCTIYIFEPGKNKNLYRRTRKAKSGLL